MFYPTFGESVLLGLAVLLTAVLGFLVIGCMVRRKAERTVRDSEARKMAMFQTALDCIISIDHEGQIVEFNPAAEQTFGYRREDVLGRELADLIIPPALRDPHRRGLAHYLATGEGPILNRRLDLTAVRADGHEFPVELTVTCIALDGPPLFTAYLRDISERQVAERAKAEHLRLTGLRADVRTALGTAQSTRIALQQCCQALVEHLDAAFARIWTVHETEQVLELQASAGMYTHLDGPHSRIRVGEFKIGRIAKSQQPHLTNDVINDPNISDPEWAKREGMIAFAGYPLVIEGRAIGVLALFARTPLTEGVLTDLGPLADGIAQYIDRKAGDERLRQNERRFRILVEQVKDYAIFMTDPEGRATSWNEGVQRVLGFAEAEFIGRDIVPLIFTPEDVENGDAGRELQRAATTGTASDDRWMRRKDGSRFFAAGVTTALRDASGKLLGFSKVMRDQTDRNRLEQELRQVAADLSEAARRKDEFLAMLAHELRNPLAPIRNGLQILKLADGNPKLLEQARTMMERQLAQMVRLVDDLLDVSRITRNKLELRKERVELSAVVNSAIETSRPLIETCGHNLTVQIPTEPIYLDADLTRLAQVLSNLLNNAAKYTERNGRIWLTAMPPSPLPSPPAGGRGQGEGGEEVVITVRDTGVGIPPAMLPKVFDLFTQVERTLDRAQGGLGIGLTLVRRLVEMHGGTVAAHSEGTGQGSTFVVRLPIAVASIDPAAARSEEGRRERLIRRRILVVDDNKDAATSLSLLLDLMGNEVRVVHDGESAVVAARQFGPDVILLDIGLPKMNGYEVCRVLRAQPGGDTLVIVACTGWGQEEDRRRSQEAGFNFHMVKPVDPAALEQLLAGLSEAY